MSAIIAESKMDNNSFKNLEEVLKKMVYILNQNRSYPDYILSLVHNKNNYEYEYEYEYDNDCHNEYDNDCHNEYDDEYDDECDDEYDDDNEKCKCGHYYYKCRCKDIKDMYDKELDDYYNNCYYNKYDSDY